MYQCHPTETSETCPNCSATLVADQRYCLSCGQPVSPVRLAFLDVLQSEYQPQAVQGLGLAADGLTAARAPAGYAPAPEPPGLPGWLRRYSGVLGLLGVLLLAMIIGLLVGHWAGQSKAPPARQVVKIEGLSGIPAVAAAPASTTPSSTPAASKSSAKAEAQEAKKRPKKPRRSKRRRRRRSKSPPTASKNSTARPAPSTPKKSTSSATTRSKRAAAHRHRPLRPRNRANRSAPGPKWKRSNERPQRTTGRAARAAHARRSRRPAWSCRSGASAPRADRWSELRRRRLELAERVAGLTWDLGGLRTRWPCATIIASTCSRAGRRSCRRPMLSWPRSQRLLASAEAGVDGQCSSCGAVHSRGAAYCWHCGAALREEARPAALREPDPSA